MSSRAPFCVEYVMLIIADDTAPKKKATKSKKNQHLMQCKDVTSLGNYTNHQVDMFHHLSKYSF